MTLSSKSTYVFAIREDRWVAENPGSIGYAVALGALAHIVRACQCAVLLNQLKFGLSDFSYYHRDPHIPILDLVALQNSGSLTFYTYRDDSHEQHDAKADTNLVTVFFSAQANTVDYYVQRGFWRDLDLTQFLRYTQGEHYKDALVDPAKLDILKQYCSSVKQSPRRKSPRKRDLKKLSQKMRKLAMR